MQVGFCDRGSVDGRFHVHAVSYIKWVRGVHIPGKKNCVLVII
jgi:hypothetical protein